MMKAFMKKLCKAILIIPFGLFLAVVLAVVIVMTPPMLLLDFFKYKSSPYWKRERRKYHFFAASAIHFKVYNEIARNALPIEYIKNTTKETIVCDFFVCNGVLLVVDVFDLSYDEETGSWSYLVEEEHEKRPIMTLEEYAELSVKDANAAAGREICTQAVILINCEEAGDINGMENKPQVMVYKNEKDRPNALRAFCKSCGK